MIYLCTITTPVEGKTGTYCPTCRRILPDKDFKRRLTPAQARARGYTRPGEVVYATWTECKECAPPPRRKTLKTMTSGEIHKAMMNGDVRGPLAKAYHDRAVKRENAGRMMGVQRRWDSEWQHRWHYARAQLREELRSTTDRIKYLEKSPPHVGRNEGFLLFTSYRELLHTLIQWMTVQAKNRAGREYLRRHKQVQARTGNPWVGERRRGRPPKLIRATDLEYIMDENSEWKHYIDPHDLEVLLDLWRDIPPEFARSRLPPLLLLATDDTRFCLRGFVPASYADADTQARRAIAAGGDAPEDGPEEHKLPKVKPTAQPDCIDHGMKGVNGGYSYVKVDGKTVLRHRAAYAHHHGLALDELPPVVRHLCNNPRCVNPLHLEGGTQRQNMEDKKRSGRDTRGVSRVLSPAQQEDIRRMYASGEYTQKQLAIMYSVSMVTLLRTLRCAYEQPVSKQSGDSLDWVDDL